VIRLKNNPRVELGRGALVVDSVFSALIPYGIGLHLNDYQSFPYGPGQLTNWAWTLTEAMENRLPAAYAIAIVATAAVVFLVNVLTLGRSTLPQKTALPQRVAIERERRI